MTDEKNPTAWIDTRLAEFPSAKRAALQELREAIARAAPEAEEVVSYKMPAFRYHGRMLVSYDGFKTHCSLFPMSSVVVEEHPELAEFAVAKGTYHFTPEHPIPGRLVGIVVRARMAEIDARPTSATRSDRSA
jgi:uncharacterized protein YdhG (YjbR/CyaY superfamily)